MTALVRLLAREPVLLGAAIIAWVATLKPSEAVMAAVVATVALVQRWLSTPTQKATEEAEQAAQTAAAQATVKVHHDLGTLALEAAPKPPPKPAPRARKAAKR